MAGDWQDMLGKLKATLPTDGDEPAVPVTEEEAPKVQKERLDIVFERKGRGGKTATIITGLTGDDDEVEALAAELKKKLGTGGSARGGEILIQGDRRNDVLKFLTQKGYKARII